MFHGKHFTNRMMETNDFRVTLKPFPPENLPDLWAWLREFPRQNFDDYGPKNVKEFQEEMLRRSQSENIIGVEFNGRLVGAMSYKPVTHRAGALHGVCFTKDVHGKGVAREALRQLLFALQAEGVEKVSATYFIDNQRVRTFLKACGFHDEGILREQTIRDGKPLDMKMVGFLMKREAAKVA